MKQQIVITANYLDRENKETPFLIRLKEENPEMNPACLIPVALVALNGGRPKSSNFYESGFGCNIVIEANIEDVAVIPASKFRTKVIKFNGKYAFEDENGNHQDKFEHVVITAGGIFTLPRKEEFVPASSLFAPVLEAPSPEEPTFSDRPTHKGFPDTQEVIANA